MAPNSPPRKPVKHVLLRVRLGYEEQKVKGWGGWWRVVLDHGKTNSDEKDRTELQERGESL